MDVSNGQNVKQCDNCHATLTGPFCAQCGQSEETTIKYFWSVLLHLLDDFFSFDSRANRTLMPLIFKPGFLTLQYFAGHRVQYVPPLRLYLFISIVFFLTLKILGNADSDALFNLPDHKNTISVVETELETLRKVENPTAETLTNITTFEQYLKDLQGTDKFLIKEYTAELVDLAIIVKDRPLTEDELKNVNELNANLNGLKTGKPLSKDKSLITIGNQADGTLNISFLSEDTNKSIQKFVEEFATKVRDAVQNNPKRLLAMVIDKLPQLMFLLLPLFALLLKLVYLFSKRLYLEHLTVALHSHSFIFITLLIIEALVVSYDNTQSTSWVASVVSSLMIILACWLPVYLYVMQKRVYKQGHLMTLFKFFIVSSAYMILISATGVIAFIWGVAAS